MISIKPKYIIILFFIAFIIFNVIYFNRRAAAFNITQNASNSLKSSEIQLSKKIWQTAPKDHEDKINEYMGGWKNIPDWSYNFMNDNQVLAHLNKTFPTLDFNKILEQRAILAYDLFRYSIINQEGGLYADSDVEKAKEFEDSMSKLSDCNVIIGVEADVRDRGDWWKGRMSRTLQFCQWSFYSAPNHPLMRFVIDRVVRTLDFHLAREHNLHNLDVMEITGPGIWTDTIKDYIKITNGTDLDEQMKCGKSYKYNDICILNVKGYALSMPHSCGKETDEDTFIIDIHHFLGSWKHD